MTDFAYENDERRRGYTLPRALTIHGMTLDHFRRDNGQGIRYATAYQDPSAWVHCNAFISCYSLHSMHAVTVRLSLSAFAPESAPITIDMRCGDCVNCVETEVLPFMRSTLWEHGIAILPCSARLDEWNTLREMRHKRWRAVVEILCRQYPVLKAGRNALLKFGEEYFPPISPLLLESLMNL